MLLPGGKLFGYDITPTNVLYAFIALIVGLFIQKIIKGRTSPLARVKLPPGLFAHSFRLIFSEDVRGLLSEWAEAAKDTGLLRFYRVTDGSDVLVVFKPEYIKQIFVTRNKLYTRGPPESFPNAPKGIFAVDHAGHAWQRKLMNPLFSYNSIKRYVKAFDNHTKDLIESWGQLCDAAPSNIADIKVSSGVTHLTLDVIGDTAFGYQFNSIKGATEVSKAFETVLSAERKGIHVFLQQIIPFYRYLPTRPNYEKKKAKKIAGDVINRIIDETKKREQAQKENEAVDLMTVLMRARDDESGKGMSDEQLCHNMWTFLIAGHETSSVCLTWTLYHLTQYPSIQERARKEAQEVIGEAKEVSSEMADKLEYITAILKESLRVTPPAALPIRETLEDVTLGDLKVPKGTRILIPAVGIQNTNLFWPDARTFKPERFLSSDSEAYAGVTGQTYLPFGAGPRNCIGSKFALLEMKVVIARLLLAFRFDISPDHPKVGTEVVLTMKPKPSPVLKVSRL